MIKWGVLATVLAATIASPAAAEVSDKIPSVGNLWAWPIGLTLVSVLCSLKRSLLGLLPLPLSAILAFGSFEMVTDEHLGPAILREQGHPYLDAVFYSSALGLLGPLIVVGLFLLVRSKRANNTSV